MVKSTVFTTKFSSMVISDTSRFLECIKEAKAKGHMALSNYIPNPYEYNHLINEGLIEHLMFDGADLITIDHSIYLEIIYFASKTEKLIKAINNLLETNTKPLSIETVIKNGSNPPFKPEAVLMRMTRVGIPILRSMPEGVRIAVDTDFSFLCSVFSTFFNPILERVPTDGDLQGLIADGKIAVAMLNEQPVGFVVGESTGRSLHLRYWYVMPQYRGFGIGSNLMRAFFAMSPESTRQYLWVFTDNENAIKRYIRYGFSPDGLKDYITLFNKNNLSYERSDH